MLLKLLYNLVIMPLIYVYELVFNLFYKIVPQLVPSFKDPILLSIFFVSLIVNILSLPLYASAEKIQKEQKSSEDRMKPYISHIKKCFSGDERYLILNAYYKSQHYNPIQQFRHALPLLLQIPFFTAAYIFFSNCKLLSGARISFLPFIKDLYINDALFSFNNFTINVLPIIMTVINLFSAYIYTKGSSLKDRIQPIILAFVFLVLLYNSPSGLVIYWTFNNIFSLFKSLYAKLSFNLPRIEFKSNNSLMSNSNSLCKASLIELLILLGMFIPINIIVSSPSEFIMNGKLPYGIIFNNFTIFLGLSLWAYFIYNMSQSKFKPLFAALYCSVTLYFILNHFSFINNLGTLTENLKYVHGFKSYNINLIKRDFLLLFIAFIIFLISFKYSRIISKLIYLIALSMFTVCAVNLFKIHFNLNDYLLYENKTKSIQDANFDNKLKLSKNGKNVIVLMLDRSCGKYFDYVLGDRKEFIELYDGFVFYKNTVSAGAGTIIGSTALFGGYDYLPQNANKRVNTLLVDKQNEALTIMPYNFSENGYDCVVANLPYENYYIGNRDSIFNNFKNVTRIDLFGNNEKKLYEGLGEDKLNAIQQHNFIMYSFMKVAPIVVKGIIYGDGRYFSTDYIGSLYSVSWWYALENLVSKSKVLNDNSNNFWLIDNELTHNSDNVIYPYGSFSPIYEGNIKSYPTITDKNNNAFNGQLAHLSTEITAYNQIAKFIKYLKDNEVYDNTRIIITSDHGTGNIGFEILNTQNGVRINPSPYNSTLLYKDFNATGLLKTNYDFMSNADTPYLAFDNLINNPINPYLNKTISKSEKEKINEIDIYAGDKGHNAENYVNDYKFKKYVASVSKGDIFDAKNWFIKEEVN